MAYLFSNGTLTDLGTLDGDHSYPYGVNNAGQVVGESGGHAFLYSNGMLQDLNSLIPADSGWVLNTASAINDKGQIVGTGTFNGQQTHGFLLTGGLMLHITDAEPVPGVVRPTDRIHYTITATASPADVQSIVVHDSLPLGTTLVPGSITDGGALQPGGIIKWKVADTAELSLSFDVKVKPAVLLPKTLHEIVDTAKGKATFPDMTTADAMASDTIPLDRGTITATGRTSVDRPAQFLNPDRLGRRRSIAWLCPERSRRRVRCHGQSHLRKDGNVRDHGEDHVPWRDYRDGEQHRRHPAGAGRQLGRPCARGRSHPAQRLDRQLAAQR
jgi:uncharacterized repeat protein (TIGR01451 family)